jgi:uncharacterized membrane protein
MKIKSILVPVLLFIFCGLFTCPVVAQTPVKTGWDDLELSPVPFQNSLKAGKDNNITIRVHNNRDSSIENIVFSASVPDKWSATFSPDLIEQLKPDDSQVVTINIVPEGLADKGYYNVTVFASAPDISRELYLNCQITSGPVIWFIIGGVLGIAVIAAFIYIFIRLNK